jgi:hypothetical protein
MRICFSPAVALAPLSALLSAVSGLAAQLLQQRHQAAGRRRHVELAHAGELGHLAGAHGADHGVAVVAARLQHRQQRLEVVFQEQHGDDDDVALRDVGLAALQRASSLPHSSAACTC